MESPPRSASLILELVALSLWLGAAVLFAAVVTPALFEVLPSRSVAGDIVGRVLPALMWAGIVVSSMVGLLEALDQQLIRTPNWQPAAGPFDWNDVVHYGGMRVAGQRAGAGMVIGLACIGVLLIGQRIDRLRASIGGPIDALAPGDPRRIEFGRLHGLSVAVLGAGMLVALGMVVSVARRLAGDRAGRRTFHPELEPSQHA